MKRTTQPAPVFSLVVTAASATGKPHVAGLARHLKAARGLLTHAPRELSVVLVGDKAMSALHVRFMNLPGPTDVLTFPIDVDPRGRVLSGEVYVCVPEARRQAKRAGGSEKKEVLLYALHGLLHLSGFNDTTGRGFNRMHRKEDEILTRLGVGRVFKPPVPAPPAPAPSVPVPPVSRRRRARRP